MKSLFAIVVGIIALLAAAACQDGGGPPASPTPTPTATATSTAGPNICRPNPDPATPDTLVIHTPKPGRAVSSPFTVSGKIAAFEATFKITVFDADGKPIVEIVGQAKRGQALSPFSEQVAFPSTEAGPACLWVYTLSARDGSIQDVGQVPILLLP